MRAWSRWLGMSASGDGKEHKEARWTVEFQWASGAGWKTVKMGILPPARIRFQVDGQRVVKAVFS